MIDNQFKCSSLFIFFLFYYLSSKYSRSFVKFVITTQPFVTYFEEMNMEDILLLHSKAYGNH